MVSSVKQSSFRVEHLYISFMYIKNKIGPKIDPCGTPAVISRYEDLLPLISVYCLRLNK